MDGKLSLCRGTEEIETEKRIKNGMALDDLSPTVSLIFPYLSLPLLLFIAYIHTYINASS